LSPDALAVAKRWLDLLPSYTKSNPHGLMFPTMTGCRVQYGKTPLFRQESEHKVNLFGRYLVAAGIDRHVRWHDLRHTCASSLISGTWGRRWTLEEVQAYMGHESRQSTERYAHLAEGVVKRALETTSIRLGGGHESVPTNPRNVSKESHPSIRNHEVGPARLELATYGLKARSSTD